MAPLRPCDTDGGMYGMQDEYHRSGNISSSAYMSETDMSLSTDQYTGVSGSDTDGGGEGSSRRSSKQLTTLERIMGKASTPRNSLAQVRSEPQPSTASLAGAKATPRGSYDNNINHQQHHHQQYDVDSINNNSNSNVVADVLSGRGPVTDASARSAVASVHAFDNLKRRDQLDDLAAVRGTTPRASLRRGSGASSGLGAAGAGGGRDGQTPRPSLVLSSGRQSRQSIGSNVSVGERPESLKSDPGSLTEEQHRSTAMRGQEIINKLLNPHQMGGGNDISSSSSAHSDTLGRLSSSTKSITDKLFPTAEAPTQNVMPSLSSISAARAAREAQERRVPEWKLKNLQAQKAAAEAAEARAASEGSKQQKAKRKNTKKSTSDVVTETISEGEGDDDRSSSSSSGEEEKRADLERSDDSLEAAADRRAAAKALGVSEEDIDDEQWRQYGQFSALQTAQEKQQAKDDADALLRRAKAVG